MSATKPEEVDALFEKGINAGDVEAVVALYEPEGSLVVAPGQVLTGTDAIRAGIAGFIAAKANLKLEVKNVVAGGDVAMVYNDWSGTMVGPDGAKVEMNGMAIEIVRRQADGSWRFVIDDPYARD